MMRWMLLKKQGGGCDYTIGCGLNYEIFDAVDKEVAVEISRDLLAEGGHLSTNPHAEWNLQEALLIQVESIDPLPLGEWLQERKAEQTAEEAKKKEAAERAQYEHLKGKYES